MSRNTIVSKPIRLGDLSFDELYSDISYNWKAKAARLQNRRWRMLSSRIYHKQPKRSGRGKQILFIENFR